MELLMVRSRESRMQIVEIAAKQHRRYRIVARLLTQGNFLVLTLALRDAAEERRIRQDAGCLLGRSAPLDTERLLEFLV